MGTCYLFSDLSCHSTAKIRSKGLLQYAVTFFYFNNANKICSDESICNELRIKFKKFKIKYGEKQHKVLLFFPMPCSTLQRTLQNVKCFFTFCKTGFFISKEINFIFVLSKFI